MCPHGFELFLLEKRPDSPKYWKHRAKQELETVPPQVRNSTTSEVNLWGGTVSNSPVVLFLTLDLLVAAVKTDFWKGGTVSNSWEGKEVILKLTLWHIIITYYYYYYYCH